MKILQTLILLIIMSVTASAEPVVQSKPIEVKGNFTHHGLGVSASMISSPFGISYQHNFNQHNRIELSGFVLYNETDNDNTNYNDSYLIYNYAIEYHYLLVEKYKAKLYYMIGAGFLYANEEYYSYADEMDIDTDRSYSIGTGVAISYKFGSSLTWDIDLGFVYRKSIFEANYYDDGERRNTNITWGVGTGLYFNF